ncbi:Response regulatory domain-containing protein [Enterobacter kobei]
MTNQEPASILLIDDHPMLRTGVKQLVSMAPDITVLAKPATGNRALSSPSPSIPI